MRRRRLNPLSGMFFNTGERREPTVDDTFGFTRQYSDTISEGMMEDERLERKHKHDREAKENPVQQPVNKPMQTPGNAPESHQSCL